MKSLRGKPKTIEPMLCTLVHEPFNDQDFVFEVKWDGYRVVAHCDKTNVRLSSRGGLDYTKKYPSVAKALQRLKADLIIDGEVVVLNNEGKPDFDALQRFNGMASGVIYYVFDVMWRDGDSLMELPLLERKMILKQLIAGSDAIRYSDHFENGLELFEQVKKLGLEGIVAKKKNSRYVPGKRGKDWLKIPTANRQEFVIGGWVESEKRDTFRTLLFGAYEGGELKWIGHAGGGFKDRDMPAILDRLKKIETRKNPFSTDVEYSEGRPHWVKPVLVANIKYSTLTKSGRIRKPAIFLGFRNDKAADDVVVEHAGRRPGIKEPRRNKLTTKPRPLPASTESNWPTIESNKIVSTHHLDVEECSITIHNEHQQLWKGVLKGELVRYYVAVHHSILPHLKDRPLTLHIKLKGPHAPGLYVKDMEGRQPDCARIFTTPRKHHRAGMRDVIDYLVCDNLPTLLYMIDLGCIDINPWTARTSSPSNPDYIVIDLDPSDDDFQKAVEAARITKSFLDGRKLTSFAKTSGKTGIHIFLPCRGFTNHEARTIAERICNEIHSYAPDFTTTSVSKKERDTSLYLDPNQNDYADTVAAPYSVRPYKHPWVSTPLQWNEINSKLHPSQFDMSAIQKRLAIKGDLFAGVLDESIAQQNSTKLKHLL